MIVASFVDARRMWPRPVIYVEHGAGQFYDGDPVSARHGSYAGGDGLSHAVLFIAPNEHVAARWRAAYPATPAVVAGSPRVDELARIPAPDSLQRCVAFAWHWECMLVPETRSAVRHYAAAMPMIVAELRGADVEVLGHGHPRAWRQLRTMWGRMGVEAVERFEDVVARAHVLVMDNSSAMYEWAALGRPVVALNAPWYRVHVEHGLRFWSHVPGPQIDHPGPLAGTILAELADPARSAHLRRHAADRAYAHRMDGHAARRAAEAIMEVLAHG